MRVRTMRFRFVIWMLMLPASMLFMFAQAVGADQDAGTVEGTVRMGTSTSPPAVAQYRTRTRAPIQPADGARAIVWLSRKDGLYPAISKLPQAQVTQSGYQFRPGMMAIRVGSSVTFPNQDDEFHSVFSYSLTKRFDLGRFRKDETSPPVVFDKAGVVKIYCEIHRHMRSILLVLESPWFTITDEAGHFRLPAIPAGDYVVHGYLPNDDQPTSPLKVVAGATTQVGLGN